MTKLLTALLAFLCLQVFSQAPPQLMNYQTVVRNNSGAILPNTSVVLIFDIHDVSATGTIVFTETQTTTSNSLGMVTAQIGSVSNLSAVNWGSGPKYLEVDASINGGISTPMGTTQLISVPYALYAETAGSSNNSAVPPGTIVAFGGRTAPTGWLLCDGGTYPVTLYPNLDAAIGNNFGGGNGYFFVPDLRGRFLRGVDTASANNAGVIATNDPDAATRTAMNTGGNTGAMIGTVEADAFASHTHNIGYTNQYLAGGQAGAPSINTLEIGGTNQLTTTTGGSETRPKNAYVNYIIKY